MEKVMKVHQDCARAIVPIINLVVRDFRKGYMGPDLPIGQE